MSKKWYIKFPGDFYAMGPIEFDGPTKEREVRRYAREYAGCTRLPNGFECWETI